MEIFKIEEVYKTTGVPTITYVQPEEYITLKVALRTPGKCVVIEGPSGIGKTTAVNKALQELNLQDRVIVLSARKPSDLNEIRKISCGDFDGIAIIDDFHRMDSILQAKISDLMKNFADEEVSDKKIIVIGINQTGNSLVKFSPDLNNRISTIKFEANSDEKIEELILKGEQALNIEFKNRNSIIREACRSFHIAQLMCQKACLMNDITETLHKKQVINFSFASVQASLSEELGRTFFEVARVFATGNRLRRAGRAPYLHCLKWLSESETWTVSLATEMQKHPTEKLGVVQIVEKGYLKDFVEKHSNISQYIHFNMDTRCLTAEDPKFIFYLKTLNWNNFAKSIGYIGLVTTPKYDFALSFAGTEREIAEKISAKLHSLEIHVFYDKDHQADILAEGVEEYLFPIYNSEAAYVVPLLSVSYPTRIWTRFESSAFQQRFGQNAVIPIWFSNATSSFDESKKYGGYEYNVNNDMDKEVDNIVKLLEEKIAIYREKEGHKSL